MFELKFDFIVANKNTKLDFLKWVQKEFPWYYLVGPMSREERRFYNAKAKRPNKRKK